MRDMPQQSGAYHGTRSNRKSGQRSHWEGDTTPDTQAAAALGAMDWQARQTDRQTHRRTDGRTEGRTGGRTDGWGEKGLCCKKREKRGLNLVASGWAAL